ncbi:hypothetical protein Pelo_7954 [Pelomyxa schiedti]|nr:hypothetical protein Pelo_7954 [Pelomyxa schiedti]
MSNDGGDARERLKEVFPDMSLSMIEAYSMTSNDYAHIFLEAGWWIYHLSQNTAATQESSPETVLFKSLPSHSPSPNSSCHSPQIHGKPGDKEGFTQVLIASGLSNELQGETFSTSQCATTTPTLQDLHGESMDIVPPMSDTDSDNDTQYADCTPPQPGQSPSQMGFVQRAATANVCVVSMSSEGFHQDSFPDTTDTTLSSQTLEGYRSDNSSPQSVEPKITMYGNITTIEEYLANSPSPTSGVQSPVQPQSGLHAKVLANTILFEWNVTGMLDSSSCASDWIGLFIYDREFSSTKSVYTYSIPSGSGIFSGLTDGYYNVRYIHCKQELLTTDPLLIGSPATVTATMSNNEIVASFQSVSEPQPTSDRDWIGLYQTGSRSNRKYIMSKRCATPLVSFPLPSKPGLYELRYFKYSSGYAYSGKTPPVEVKSPVSISTTIENSQLRVQWQSRIPSSTYDWIGVYLKGADSHSYVTFKYCTQGTLSPDSHSGCVTFQTPQLPHGEVDVRFFSGNDKYTALCVQSLVL